MSEEKKKGRSENKIIDIRKAGKMQSISFSTEEMEDPQMDEMMRESIKREANLLEKELNEDPELVGVGVSDDLFLSIVNKLKEQGAWEEEEEHPQEVNMDVDPVDNVPENEQPCVKQEEVYQLLSEEDRQALMLGREVAKQKEEKKRRMQRQRRGMRRIASVAAVFVVVFMVGMTSEANRRLVLNAWDAVMTMTGFTVTTNYSEKNKVVRLENTEEELAWKDAEEKLGISPLAFVYMPDGLEFEQYEVLKEMKMATFLYRYNKNVIEIKTINVESLENNGSIYLARDEKAIFESNIVVDKNVEVEIWRTDISIDEPSYLSEFEYNNCRYVLSGMISLDEMKKIVKNMIFL